MAGWLVHTLVALAPFIAFPSPLPHTLSLSSFVAALISAGVLPSLRSLKVQHFCMTNSKPGGIQTLHDISILNHIEPSKKRSLITSCWISRCKARRCCSPSSVSSTAGAVVSVVFTFFSLASLGLSVCLVCGASSMDLWSLLFGTRAFFTQLVSFFVLQLRTVNSLGPPHPELTHEPLISLISASPQLQDVWICVFLHPNACVSWRHFMDKRSALEGTLVLKIGKS